MEDFSQSRGDDDLFDDEITPFDDQQIYTEQISQHHGQTPVKSTVNVPPPIEAISAAVPAPSTAPSAVQSSAPQDTSRPGFGPRPQGRGSLSATRGRGGGPRKASAGLEESKWAAKPADNARPTASKPNASSKHTQSVKAAEIQPVATTNPSDSPSDTPAIESTTQPDSTEAVSLTTAQPPTAPSTTRPQAVRGDRTQTGGPARTKLTEEQLSAKIAAAKARSETLSAAHARAQADAADFEARERLAGIKREVERKELRVLQGERERNRLRKLGGTGGREWDRDKDEANSRPERGYTPRNGDGETDDLRQYEWHEDRRGGRGRGRGGRDRGDRGRGRGRGGHNAQYQPNVSGEADFPSLPGSNAPSKTATAATGNEKPKPKRIDSLGGEGAGGTWADQVEQAEE